MGNSTSTSSPKPEVIASASPTRPPTNKRSRGNCDREATTRSKSPRVDQKSKRAKMSSDVATGRLLVKNCRVWTWDDDGIAILDTLRDEKRRNIKGHVSELQWLCVDHNGRFSSLSSAPISPHEDYFDTVIDAAGQLVLPGLMDAHLHVLMTGESAYYLDLQGCTSIAQLQRKLADHQEAHPELPWIVGVNWDQTPFGRYPTRQDLDAVSPITPVFLWRACWHIGVANSTALKRGGIDLTATVFDVAGGGEVECTAAGPTGILKESAVQLVASAMGSKSEEDKSRFIAEGLARCCRMGLTSVQTNDEYSIGVYQGLQRAGEGEGNSEEGTGGGLPCRVFLTPVYEETLAENNISPRAAVASSTPSAVTAVQEKSTLLDVGVLPPAGRLGSSLHLQSDPSVPVESLFTSAGSLDLGSQQSLLCIERVKIFGDGSLGAETAAISISLEDESGSTGPTQVAGTPSDPSVNAPAAGEVEEDGISEALRTVKISFPEDVGREIDYAFQESLQQYLQLYGAVSHISFQSFSAEGNVTHLAEVLFKEAAGARRCSEEWELTNPPSRPYKLRYVGKNSFGESVMTLEEKGSGSALVTPNSGPVGPHKGLLTHQTEDLVDMIAHCKQLGYRVEIHAIGDTAAAQALYAIEKGGMVPSDRPVLTHCQILSGRIMEEMLRLGVVANVQPSFVPTDMKRCWCEQWVTDRVSLRQLKWAYSWKTMLDAGIIVAGGSDAPIETCSPFTGMHDAILRRARPEANVTDSCPESSEINPRASNLRTDDRNSEDSMCDLEVFRPEECLSFAEALWLYTVGAACAANSEHVLGQVKEGFAADLVLVNPAIVSDPALLMDYTPEVVVVGGVVRHINPSAAPGHGVSVSGVDCGHTQQQTQPQALGGPFIPGKNGRDLPPVVAHSHKVVSHNGSVQPRNLQRQGGVGGVSLGLPRGGGFCACWIRGRHCQQKQGGRSGERHQMQSTHSKLIVPGDDVRVKSDDVADDSLASFMYCMPVMID